MTILNRENIVIRKNIRNFPIIELTQQEYNSLDDYSVAYPHERPINDIGKIPELSLPGENLIEMIVNEGCVQIMYCEIIEIESE